MGGGVAVARRPTLQLSTSDSFDGTVEHVERVSAFKEGYCRENDVIHREIKSTPSHTKEGTPLLESKISAGSHFSQREQQQEQVAGLRESPTESKEPPEWVVKGIAYALQSALGLQLFNFDMLTPTDSQSDASVYYIVDINYFPGYEKLPGHTQRFVNFLSAVLSRGCSQGGPIGPESYCSCVQMPSET